MLSVIERFIFVVIYLEAKRQPLHSTIVRYQTYLNNDIVKKQMSRLPLWNFDIFETHKYCGSFTLPIIALTIFDKLDMGNKYKMSKSLYGDYMLQYYLSIKFWN